MDFNLNEFLGAVANTLDVIEITIFGMPTNHSKRIAFIAVKMAHELRLTQEEIFDLISLALLHDNGACMTILHGNLKATAKEKLNVIESVKEHCNIGEDNLTSFPFLTHPKNIIKYHHEQYDGSGFFGLSEDEIPLFAQIIALPDSLDRVFDLRNILNRELITAFVREHRNTFFSPLLSDVFLKIADQHGFWEALSDKNIDDSLKEVTPVFNVELSFNEIRTVTKTFSKIIDAKSRFTQEHSSGLSEKLEKMADFYKIDSIMTLKLLIASDLHDLGKLVISNDILDKPGKLTKEEFEEIKLHPKIARDCLKDIKAFEEITKWIYNHHEKLDGSGYPQGLVAKDLAFNSRLLTCLDIYQALREDRPYRQSMDHCQAMEVLNSMVEAGQLDHMIVDDINSVFLNI